MCISIELSEIESYYDRTMLFCNSRIENFNIPHEEYIDNIIKYLKDETLIENIKKSSKEDNIFYYYEGKKIEDYMNMLGSEETAGDKLNFIKRLRNFDGIGGRAQNIIKSIPNILFSLDKHEELSGKDFAEIKQFCWLFRTHVGVMITRKFQIEEILGKDPFLCIGAEINNITDAIQRIHSTREFQSEFIDDLREINLIKELRNKIFYLYFFYIMYLMLESPFLLREEQIQLKKLYKIFYNNMHDSEILCLENNPVYFNETSKIETRGKEDNTTRLTIIFCRNRINLYKLRLDLSHKGVEFHHINLMNSDIKEFIFLNQDEVKKVKSSIGDEDFKKIFIYIDDFNLYSFNNDYKNNINKLPLNKQSIVNNLYKKKSHKFVEMKIMPNKNIFKILEKSFELLSINNNLSINKLKYSENGSLLFLEAYKEYQLYLELFINSIYMSNFIASENNEDTENPIVVHIFKSIEKKLEKLDIDEKILKSLKRLKENSIKFLNREVHMIEEIRNDIFDIDSFFQNLEY